MVYYTTYGEFQHELEKYYKWTGNKLQFPEATRSMYKRGILKNTTTGEHVYENLDPMTDAEFDRFIDDIPFPIFDLEALASSEYVFEESLIQEGMDIFAFRHPRLTREFMHKHNFFEVNFVISGEAKLYFESEVRTMKEGEICIIAPSSKHDFQIEDSTSIVFTICIRSSTFNTSFFGLLSGQDLLSYFFRTILQGKKTSNYLLFYTKKNAVMVNALHRLILECSCKDQYSNLCGISYVNIVFSAILRNYSQTVSFYDYKMGTDFSLVLQYIQHNYQNVTLASLASIFHYSEPHLCTLIRQNTGMTFTTLIKKLRLSDSVDYLVHSDMKIGEIAEMVGYNSADHFSRIFRSAYNMSPMDYRKRYQNMAVDKDALPPFNS